MTRKEKLVATFEATIGLRELPEELKSELPDGALYTFKSAAHLISGSTESINKDFVKLFGMAIDELEKEKHDFSDQELQRYFINMMMKNQGGQGTEKGWNAVKK
jgi:hypothetical protein